jgi:DNA-binding NtrC family response regulator
MSDHPQILIAENNGIIASDIQYLLTNWGYDAPALADSVDMTFDIIKHREPDLIVMGTQLKDSNDCLHLATWISKTYRVPMIVFVVWIDREVEKYLNCLKSFYCLSEPFDYENLRKLVHRALKKRRN